MTPAIEHGVDRLLRHPRMIGEVGLLGPLLRGVGTEQHDVQRLDAVAVELPFGLVDVARADLLARPFVGQVEHDAVAVAVLDRNPFGARRVRLHVPPRIDVRADVVAGDDHAVVGDLVDAVLVGADAARHLAVALHLDDDRLGDVGVGHHPLVDLHAEVDEPARHLPCHPPSTKIDWPVR